MSCAIAIAPMVRHTPGGFARWAFATDQRRRDRHGRMPMLNWLIGSIRREVLDHVVVLGERHLRHVLLSYMTYYNEARTHLSFDKDAPIPREAQGVGRIFAKLALRRSGPLR